MDGGRFDALTRVLRCSRSRRAALGAALLMATGGALPALGQGQGWRVDRPRRRNACQVRCGLAQRMCRADCRRIGSAARECKRLCKVTRDGCFLRCKYRPARKRFATRDPNG